MTVEEGCNRTIVGLKVVAACVVHPYTAQGLQSHHSGIESIFRKGGFAGGLLLQSHHSGIESWVILQFLPLHHSVAIAP